MRLFGTHLASHGSALGTYFRLLRPRGVALDYLEILNRVNTPFMFCLKIPGSSLAEVSTFLHSRLIAVVCPAWDSSVFSRWCKSLLTQDMGKENCWTYGNSSITRGASRLHLAKDKYTPHHRLYLRRLGMISNNFSKVINKYKILWRRPPFFRVQSKKDLRKSFRILSSGEKDLNT